MSCKESRIPIFPTDPSDRAPAPGGKLIVDVFCHHFAPGGASMITPP